MSKKFTYSEIRQAQDQVPTEGLAANYVLGAYESLIAQIVAYDLPLSKQQEFLRSLEALKVRAAQFVD